MLILTALFFFGLCTFVVVDLPNGDKAYRLSLPKTYSILDNKHTRLSLKSTFVASPNMLGRTFERRWSLDSDPSPYLISQIAAGEGEETDCKVAQELRRRIAAEVIATNLPPLLAAEYFTHLEIGTDA